MSPAGRSADGDGKPPDDDACDGQPRAAPSLQPFDGRLRTGLGPLVGDGSRLADELAGQRTQGGVEARVCEIMSAFVRQLLGRGPTEVRAFLVEDMLLVRLKGTLTAAEKHLSTMMPAEKGRDLVKESRSLLVAVSECQLRHLIEAAVERRCLAVHHDVSTITGEQMFVFALEGRPACRDAKARR